MAPVGLAPVCLAPVSLTRFLELYFGVPNPSLSPGACAMNALLYSVVDLVPVALSLVVGAVFGSFLNVVVYRLPAGVSLWWPPSRCPHCDHRLALGENVPILGWLRLKGRCKNCRGAIAPRYPLVEAATALLFGLVFWRYGPSWQTLGYWLFFCWLLALALIDWDTLTLPNPLTKSGLVLGISFQTLLGWLTDQRPLPALLGSVAGAVLGLWLLGAIGLLGTVLFRQDAMGGGDAKLAAMMGAWLGWKLLVLGIFLAALVGAVVGLVGVAVGLLQRRQQMPFGPCLALGAAVSALWGQGLIGLYLGAFFPAG